MLIPDDIMRLLNKSKAYKAVFMKDGVLTPDAQVVLTDLARFCKANSSTLMISPIGRTVDPLATVYAEGKREVFLRIQNILKLDEANLINADTEGNDD